MAFLDYKMQQEPRTFNWDDINVGNNQLDNSQNFFSKKHYEHERLDDMEFLRQKIVMSEVKEVTEQVDLLNSDKENSTQNVSQEQHELKAKLDNLTINTSSVKTESPADESIKSQDGKGQVKKIAPNLACEWSTKKIINTAATVSKGAISKVMPPPPQAYLIKDLYQRKREEAERRRAEDERKKREFHSRPAPKFDVLHEQFKKRKPLHAITTAITPQVLKKSREFEEKRKKRLEEWKLKNQPLKFEPRSPTVLKEKPFVPEKKPTVVQLCPFNLHIEKRLQERKHYDELKQKALEEKQKQEEEERKKREEERIKELRKATTFKARPNPFKN